MTIETHPYAYQPVQAPTRESVLLNGVHAPTQCANYHCRGHAGFLNTPFCDDCLWKLWAHIDGNMPEEKKVLARESRFDELHMILALQNQRAAEHEKYMAERKRHEFMTTPGTIYYLSVGDLVKIGWTFDLEQRMRQYPPNSVLLADHPGTRETERQMHHKFLHRIAKGREWFTPCDEIDQHIESVRSKFATA